MIFKKKNKETNKPETAEQKFERKQLTEEEIAKIEEKFNKSISKIKLAQDTIESRSAAFDALFVRRFKKFQNIQEYLDLLKRMKFNHIYKDYEVDLDSGDTDSIDEFCQAVLKKTEYKKNYREVQIVKVEFDEELEEELKNPIESNLDLDAEARIVFTKEDESDERENIQKENKGRKGNSKDVSEDAQSAGSKDTGSEGSDSVNTEGTSGKAVSVDKKKAEAQKETDLVAKKIQRFIKGSGVEISVNKLFKEETSPVFDVKITDKDGNVRVYLVDNGSVIPGKLAVLTSRKKDNASILIPLVKNEEELIKNLFLNFKTLTKDEYDHLQNDYYLPDLDLYNFIDFTDAKFIGSLKHAEKAEFAKNIRYIVDSVEKTIGRNLRFRISEFNDVDEFTLSSDSKCMRPVIGTEATEIGGISAVFKPNSNIRIVKSEERVLREEHEAKVAKKEAKREEREAKKEAKKEAKEAKKQEKAS